MLLAVDIGNSNIKFGIFNGNEFVHRFSIPTESDLSVDELKAAVDANPEPPISDILLCSVVPDVEKILTASLRNALNIEPVLVNNDFNFGMKINYKPLSTLGTDRLVGAFAAVEKYGAACIVCSFGTATTIDVVGGRRELLGGIIAPGMRTMAKALRLNTAQLPDVDVVKPGNIIGKTTIESIQSGVFYGHVAMFEGLIARVKKVFGGEPKVIATGGFAPLIADNTNQIDIVNENLTLDGLQLLHRRMF